MIELGCPVLERRGRYDTSIHSSNRVGRRTVRPSGRACPGTHMNKRRKRALAKQLGDRSKVLLKVIELCKTPLQPEQLYLTARAYSFPRGPYAEETERAQLPICPQTVGRLPRRTVEEEGILINRWQTGPTLCPILAAGRRNISAN